MRLCTRAWVCVRVPARARAPACPCASFTHARARTRPRDAGRVSCVASTEELALPACQRTPHSLRGVSLPPTELEPTRRPHQLRGLQRGAHFVGMLAARGACLVHGRAQAAAHAARARGRHHRCELAAASRRPCACWWAGGERMQAGGEVRGREGAAAGAGSQMLRICIAASPCDSPFAYRSAPCAWEGRAPRHHPPPPPPPPPPPAAARNPLFNKLSPLLLTCLPPGIPIQ